MLSTIEMQGLVQKLNACAPILREVKDESDHREALELLEDLLMDYDNNVVLIEALSSAIQRYEDSAEEFEEFNRFQSETDPALAILKVLMEQYELNMGDFENEIGKKSMVSQVLNGKRNLTREHIEKLSKRFSISPALFFQ
jgi:HTH-type transcriptional regulator / antitoxin HigA